MRSDVELRIKPLPTMRTIRLDELPSIFWVRKKDCKQWCIVYMVDEEKNSITTSSCGTLALETCRTGQFEWSHDRKVGYPFEKSEAQ